MPFKTLIVDDSFMCRIIIREFLDLLGHPVVGEASSGAEALAIYESLRPDLVTLDISLSDTDGISVLQRLRELDPAARVVIVSGNDQDSILADARRLGALGHLVKPVQLQAFKDLLARLEKPA